MPSLLETLTQTGLCKLFFRVTDSEKAYRRQNRISVLVFSLREDVVAHDFTKKVHWKLETVPKVLSVVVISKFI